MAEHWCKEHQTVWFKKGKMKGYAHPILDTNGEPTGDWCNEPKSEAVVESKTPEPSRSGSTNDSIESQVAFKGMIELIIAGKLDKREADATIRWAMGRIALPSVIVTKIEEAKGETTKNNKGDKETQAEPSDRQDSREATESDAERVSGFLKYLKEHGKKDPRLWLDVEYGIPQDEKLTPKKCEILYKAIKTKEKW